MRMKENLFLSDNDDLKYFFCNILQKISNLIIELLIASR